MLDLRLLLKYSSEDLLLSVIVVQKAKAVAVSWCRFFSFKFVILATVEVMLVGGINFLAHRSSELFLWSLHLDQAGRSFNSPTYAVVQVWCRTGIGSVWVGKSERPGCRGQAKPDTTSLEQFVVFSWPP